MCFATDVNVFESNRLLFLFYFIFFGGGGVYFFNFERFLFTLFHYTFIFKMLFYLLFCFYVFIFLYAAISFALKILHSVS